jgi:hypothetical protein
MTRRILGSPCAAILFALFLGAFHLEASLASPAPPAGPNVAVAVDSDGDGITDDMDPDDDNDGLPDSSQGGDGTSSGNDPLPDSDDDDITDDMDPDDNNNAVTDEDEPVPPPSGGNSSSPGGTSNSGSSSSSDQPLVKALPITGAGTARPLPAPNLMLYLSIFAMSLAKFIAGQHTLRPARSFERSTGPS